MADQISPTRMPYHRWLRAVTFTALVVVLIAVGVTDEIGFVTFLILAAVFAASGAFLWLFPGSRFFVLSFANSLAIYTCVFIFLANENFANVGQWAIVVGYLLPIFSFLIGAWWYRDEIHRIAYADNLVESQHPSRIFAWLIPVIILSAMTFLAPLLELDTTGSSLVLLAGMGVTSIFVILMSRAIAIFLIDTGLLFDQFFVRMLHLFVPAFAFFTLYSFNVIMFAMIYRIIDRFSSTPQFFIDGNRQTISFIDSLYFSLITVSTVGYGDVTPATDSIRAVTAIEVMIGVLLLLFGFYELIRFSRRAHEQGRE